MALINKENTIPFKLINDLKIPKTANKSYFQEAISYKVKTQDIFLVSYPKCGTTWTQHIIYLVFNKGVPAKNLSDIIATVPFPEQDGYPNLNMPIFAMKYHLPFQLMPFLEGAKYIVVVRNPMDACVSYYHFLRNLPNYNIESFNVFYEAFLAGDVPYGDYFDHLISWYEKRFYPNVLFITYEFLKSNHLEAVKQIAKFLGKEEIANDERILKDIVYYSSLDYMKTFIEGGNFMKNYLRISSTVGMTDNLQDINKMESEKSTFSKEPKMIRRGCVGDWKNYFSGDQENFMKRKFNETGVGKDLWPEIFEGLET